MSELAAALQAESAAKRWQAIANLPHTPPVKLADTATLALLVQALADEHPFVRWQAGLALASREDGRQKLIELLKGEPEAASAPLARSAAVDALGARKSADLQALLIDSLQTGDALLRQSAAEALASQGNLAAVPHLIAALKDGDPWVRRAAAYALGHLGDKQVAEVLVESLTDQAVVVRRSAAYALGALRADGALAKLKISLTDNDPQVRRNAAWALGRIGLAEAVPDLTRLLDDPALNGMVAAAAHEAIEVISKPRWLRLLWGVHRHFQ